jgi:hypothetical protein
MTKFKNKLVYDSATGEIRDDRKFMTMLEDFWLPRREGSKGTEITTLAGGMNLGELEDVKYFEKKLYKSLGVPTSRLESQQGFSLGRSTEVTRDELKFNKFIQRLRNKFSILFDDLLRVQLILKRICTEEEWKEFKEDIWYDFKKDNNFNELKEAELMTNRLTLLQVVDPYVGRYYSMEWVRKNVLQMDDDDIAEINEQIAKEQAAAAPTGPVDSMGNPMDPNAIPPTTAQAAAAGGPPQMNQMPAGAPQAKQLAPPDGSVPLQEEQPPSKFELQENELEFA